VRSWAIAAGAVLAACGPQSAHSGALRVAADRAAYAPGDSVAITLRNASSAVVEYNACPRAIERRAGAGWAVVDRFPPPSGMCNASAHALPPGREVTVRFALPADLPSGTYRVRLPWSQDRATGPFTVGGGAR